MMKNLKISLTTLIVAVLAVICICVLATSPADYFIYPLIAIAIAVFAELWNASETNLIKASNLLMLLLSGSLFALNVLDCNRHILCVLISETILLLIPSITMSIKPTIEKVMWLIYSILIVALNIGDKTPISWIYVTFAIILMYSTSVTVSSKFKKIRLKDIKNRLIFVIISSIMLALGLFFSPYSHYFIYVLIICAWAITLATITLIKKKKAIKKVMEFKRAQKEREEAETARAACRRAVTMCFFDEDDIPHTSEEENNAKETEDNYDIEISDLDVEEAEEAESTSNMVNSEDTNLQENE